jgi:hypothetical protein
MPWLLCCFIVLTGHARGTADAVLRSVDRDLTAVADVAVQHGLEWPMRGWHSPTDELPISPYKRGVTGSIPVAPTPKGQVSIQISACQSGSQDRLTVI